MIHHDLHFVLHVITEHGLSLQKLLQEKETQCLIMCEVYSGLISVENVRNSPSHIILFFLFFFTVP